MSSAWLVNILGAGNGCDLVNLERFTPYGFLGVASLDSIDPSMS